MEVYDTDSILEKLYEERRTRVREIEVREAKYDTGPSSPGYELSIPTSDRSTQVISLNIKEIRAWGEAMIAYAEEHESK